MSKTVLVTGGSGILGQHLVGRLLEAGKNVIILCRKPQPALFADPPLLQWLCGDVSKALFGLEPSTYRNLVAQIGLLFHLAARTDFKGNSLAEYQPVNIDGVHNAHTFAVTAGIPLHHVSTAFVCGDYRGVFAESMLDEGQGFRNFYEQSKFLGEKYLRQQQQDTSFSKVTIYRPSIILERNPTSDSGKHFGPFTFLDALFRILLAERRKKMKAEMIRVQGNKNRSMPFVFDDMVADAIVRLAEEPANHGKTFHLTSQNSFTNEAIESLFNQSFGKEVVCWATPEDISRTPLRPAEELLARRTKVYADYLGLDLAFARQNLDEALDQNTLADLSTEEVLDAFSRFLSRKGEKTRKGQTAKAHESTSLHDGISDYFTSYLPGFLGKPLLKNLTGLTVVFWLEIRGVGTWAIRIGTGCLQAVNSGKDGDFGYSVDSETFVEVVSGKRSPQEGFFRGQISISGNTREGLRTATALEEFFSQYPYQNENS